jgi:hypothetical protein
MRKLEGGISHNHNIRKGIPDQAQGGQPHYNNEEALGTRQSIQQVPPTQEVKGNQQGKGGKEDRNQEHPRQSLTGFIATEENKAGVACKDSIV